MKRIKLETKSNVPAREIGGDADVGFDWGIGGKN